MDTDQLTTTEMSVNRFRAYTLWVKTFRGYHAEYEDFDHDRRIYKVALHPDDLAAFEQWLS